MCASKVKSEDDARAAAAGAGGDAPRDPIPSQPVGPFGTGDKVPNFALPDPDGEFRLFYERVRGRPLVILVAGDDHAAMNAEMAAFAERAEAFEAAGVELFAIAGAAPDPAAGWARVHYVDEIGKVRAALRQHADVRAAAPVALLCDPNQRLLAAPRVAEGARSLAEDALATYTARPAGAPPMATAAAPILIVEHTLDPQLCRDLIRFWEEEEEHSEGHVTSVIDGEVVHRIHHDRKKARGRAVEDPNLHRYLVNLVGRRIAPEVYRAFHVEGFNFERFNVTCYEAERGDHFAPHRDNQSPETASRIFGLSINLNSDEYEGGELVFPEYNVGYKGPSGAAMVFSSALLHWATTPTSGRRFTLLSFLRAAQKPDQR